MNRTAMSHPQHSVKNYSFGFVAKGCNLFYYVTEKAPEKIKATFPSIYKNIVESWVSLNVLIFFIYLQVIYLCKKV